LHVRTPSWNTPEFEQNPATVSTERVILDALLETDGDDFAIDLDVQLSVGLEQYEVPATPLLLWVTSEVAAIVEMVQPVAPR
jgi:hypothetical protein